MCTYMYMYTMHSHMWHKQSYIYMYIYIHVHIYIDSTQRKAIIEMALQAIKDRIHSRSTKHIVKLTLYGFLLLFRYLSLLYCFPFDVIYFQYCHFNSLKYLMKLEKYVCIHMYMYVQVCTKQNIWYVLKHGPNWLNNAPLGIHVEPINKELMLLVII